jgi:hypothetical protein
MFNQRADTEDTYIMGYRMISFLMVYLPQHPEYKSPEAAEMREETRYELDQLQSCLERLALQIDEDQLNRFITDDFEPIVDDFSDSESGNGSLEQGNDFQSTPQKQQTANWEPFANWGPESQRKQADSPTVDTVATTGTESLEQYEISSDESEKELSEPQGQLGYSQDFYDDDEGDYHDEQSPSRFHTVELELDSDFLERIASEDVKYETDSEAMDSWAQDSESEAPSASSGGVTYDPARLVVRALLNRCPRGMESPVNEDRARISMDSAGAAVESLLGERPENENAFDAVIDDFLDDSSDEDEPAPMPLRKTPLVPSQLENYVVPRPNPTGKENQVGSFSPFVKPDILVQDEWVSFDSDNRVHKVEFSSMWNTRTEYK